MTDPIDPTLPARPIYEDNSAGTLRDPSLFLSAAEQWTDCRQQLLDLIGAAPGARASLRRLLKTQLALDGDLVGLRYDAPEADNSERNDSEGFVSLLELTASVAKQPDLTALNLDATVSGLPEQHPLQDQTPVQLAQRLKDLNAQVFVVSQWDDYWNARAPGTSCSRRDLAARHFTTHLYCACQLTYAQGALTAKQLKPLLVVLEASDREPLLDDQPVAIETLSLLPWGSGSQRLPGALVITHSGEAADQQLLFVPGQAPALSLFPDRNALQAYLLQHKQRLWPEAAQTFSADDNIGYGRQTHGITALFKELVDCLRSNLINSIYRNDDAPLPHGALAALTSADAFDTARQSTSLLAPAPQLPEEQDSQARPSLFGQLYADLDFAARQASIAQQQDAFKALLGADYQGDANDPRLLDLKRAINDLSREQRAAFSAAHALLQAQTPQDLYTLRQRPNAHYDALYQARLAGLRAEARIQRALQQLDSAESAMIDSVLEAPSAIDRLDSEVVAASVSVSMDEQDGDSQVIRSRELDGVLVITRKGVIDGTSASDSLLLYWPGIDGGLQRFASRGALEAMLLKTAPDDDELTLTLTALNGDALAYGLQNQLYRCEQQATQLLTQYLDTEHASEQKKALQSLLEQTLNVLRVPQHRARETAYAQLLEVNRSSALHEQLPDWLATLPISDRHLLKALIQQYVPAVQRAQAVLEGNIPPREDFIRARVQERLRNDFSISGNYTLSLDLPDSIHRVADPIEGSGAGGVPIRTVPQPSDQRTTYTLEQLALANIDDDLRERYAFVNLSVTGGDAGARDQLLAGFTYQYLHTLVTTLDLPATYTALIRSTFMGTPDEAPFKQQYRRECLRTPIQLALQMQGAYALHRRLLDAPGKAIFDIAIDADSPQAYQVDGRRIVLRAAQFSAGGSDTAGLTTTLSGVTFIEEQSTGQTLVYLPDDPLGGYLRHYESLEAAREGLFQLTLDARIAEYLADRALLGDQAAHLSRLREAHDRNFCMIGAAQPWPQSTSLANHLLDAHMGRLIETHRRTSRSNDELYLQQFALASDNVFHYIKMALGMVPFVGTAVGLYDGLNALSQSVEALLRKNLYQGLEHFESVMLSLIDAAMDLLPGAGIASVRGATRQRQLQDLARRPSPLRQRYPSQGIAAPLRFEGYEDARAINLSGLQPASAGIYRGVYRHAEGDFIISQGRTYQVTLHDSPRTWRLQGTTSKTYQQPITLDERGQWRTHGAVYGTLVNGGLAGGGGVLGHLADGLEPLWPAPVRGYLPDWLTNRLEHRRRVLLDVVESKKDAVQSQTRALMALKGRLDNASPAERAALLPQFNAQSLRLLDAAKQTYAKLLEAHPFLTGANARKARDDLSSLAATIVQRTEQEFYALKQSIHQRYDQLDKIRAESSGVPFGIDHIPEHMALWARRKQVRLGLAEDAKAIEARLAQMTEWEAKVTLPRHRSGVINDAIAVREKHNPCVMNVHKAQQYVEAINRYDIAPSADWFALINEMKPRRNRLERALDTQLSLPEVTPKPAAEMRQRVLEQCIQTYNQYRTALNVWVATYPSLFDTAHVAPLLKCLQELTTLAHDGIRKLPGRGDTLKPGNPQVPTVRRLFEVEEVGWVSGIVEHPDTPNQRITLTGANGETEVLIVEPNGRARLEQVNAAPAPAPNLPALQAAAERRLQGLDDFVGNIEGHARRNALPQDLEVMMTIKADELERQATAIEDIAAGDPLVAKLRSKAIELRAKGQALHIAQCFASKTPTEGYLDYLLRHDQVAIVRIDPRQELTREANTRADFLQEYEVRDLRTVPAPSLWFAHFHFSSKDADFEQFTKAHLKIPEQRYRGLKWQAAQVAEGADATPIWRGNIGRPLAERHFAAL